MDKNSLTYSIYLYIYEDMNGRAEGGPAALPTAEAESRSSSYVATTAPRERACAASTADPSGADLARSGGPATGSPASRTGWPGSGSSAPLPAVKQEPSTGKKKIFVFRRGIKGSLQMHPSPTSEVEIGENKRKMWGKSGGSKHFLSPQI